MRFVRKYLLWTILVAVLAFAANFYVNKKGSCDAPIQYTVVAPDPRFHIGKEDFVTAIDEAAHIWEKATGKDLFVYTPKPSTPTRWSRYFSRSPIVVSLYYDTRQQKADVNRVLISQIDDTKDSADQIRFKFQTLQKDYQKARAEYLVLLADYRIHHTDWNTLEEKRLEVNALIDEINTLVKKYNYLVGQVNDRIEMVNQSAGMEFEEGKYSSDDQGEKITVYEFANRAALVRVLAHEFGHALDLNHNPNPQSVMYYLNNSTNIVPTHEDIAALKAVCGMK